MKRRVWLYILTALITAGLVAGTVVSFLYAQYVVGGVLAFCTAVGALALWGEVAQDTFFKKSDELFRERRFDEEKKMLDKVENNHVLFPFVRIGFYLLAIQNAAARDSLEEAKSYISRLRYGGDLALKYRSAYVLILIYLDENNVQAAREEYEDFRSHNKDVALYASQLEVLGALFKRLFTRTDERLPEGAVNSYFPVVKRILGRHFEEKAASSHEDWGE